MAKSGMDGNVYVDSVAVADITRWSLSETHRAAEYKSNDTEGGTKRVAGYTDWSATFEYVLPDAGKQAFAVGDSITVKLETATGAFYTGTCFVEDLSVDVDVEGPGVIRGTCAVAGDGALTPPT